MNARGGTPLRFRDRQEAGRVLATRLQAWLDDGCDVYAYFNNDWYGHAVADARWLRERLLPPATTRSASARSRAH